MQSWRPISPPDPKLAHVLIKLFMLIADTAEVVSVLRQGGKITVYERVSKPMFINTCDVARGMMSNQGLI